ncbi:MAG: hypothetical protein M1812_003928 [Candelaria pacifica]|nr:MAG: hypothetical protein M1812_003928 [Candelaria pacifica]
MDQEDSSPEGGSDSHPSSETRLNTAKATQGQAGKPTTATKKPLGTKPPAKRPTIATAPSFSKPTTSSVSRTTPMSSASKPVPRPGSTGTRNLAGGTPASSAVKPVHRAQPSTSSSDDTKSSSMAAPSARLSKADAASIKSPALKRPLSAASKRLTPGSQTNVHTRTAIGRAGSASPTKVAQKPSANPSTPTAAAKLPEKPATKPVPSSPDAAEKPMPSTPKPSRLGTPSTTTKQRPSTAADSTVSSPYTSARPNTAPSVSNGEPDPWEQRAKEMEVVNEMLKESTARESLQDQIKDLTGLNDTLRRKLKNARDEQAISLDSTSIVVTLTAKLNAHEQKISALQEELDVAHATLNNLRQTSNADSASSKGALEQLKAEHALALESTTVEHHHELAALRTTLETMETKQGDYRQKMGRELEQAKRSASERRLRAERLLEEETALHKIQLDDFNDRLTAEQKAHAEATAGNSTLQSEVAELKTSLDQAKKIKADAFTQQEDLVRRKELEITGMRKAVSELQHEVQSLHESKQRELDAKTSELTKQHAEVMADLRATHEEALSSIGEERLASLVEDGNVAEELKVSVQKEIETLRKDNHTIEASLNIQLAELQTANHKLQGQLEQEETVHKISLQDAKEDLQELERALEALQRDAEASAEKNNSLQETIQQSRETIETLKASQAAARDEIHRLNMRDDAHAEKIEALKLQLLQEDADLRKDGKTAAQWSQAYSTMKEEHADTLSELQKRTGALQKVQEAQHEMELNTSDMSERIAGYVGQLELLQSQMTEKEGRIGVLNTELLSSQDDLKSVKADLDTLRLSGENKEDSLRGTSPSKKQIRQLRKSRSKLIDKEATINKPQESVNGASTGAMASDSDHIEGEQDTGLSDISGLNETLKPEVQKSQENIKSMEARNRSLEEQLRKSQSLADAKATRLNEFEALLKVTAAELTELKTNRPKRTVSGSPARPSSPMPPKTPRTPTRRVTPLRRSGWAIGDENSHDGEGGNTLQGTVSFPFSSPSWNPFR